MKTLFYNSVHCCLCGDNIQSYHRHNYKHCSCGNASVDGGVEYSRYGWKEEGSVIDFSMYIEEQPFSIIRQYFYRFNSEDRKYVILKDIPDDWLNNIIEYYLPDNTGVNSLGRMTDSYLLLFIMEKQFRMYGEE